MPIALGVIGIGMSVAGGIQGAMAGRSAAEREAQYYEYLAQQNDETTEMYKRILPAQLKNIKNTAEHNVTRVQDSAADASKVIARTGKKIAGSQAAVAAAKGVTGGTLEDISTDTANAIQEDIITTKYEADLKSWDIMTLADQQEREASFQGEMKINDLMNKSYNYRMGGANARDAGNSAMWGSLLSTAGSTAQSGYSLGKTQGWCDNGY